MDFHLIDKEYFLVETCPSYFWRVEWTLEKRVNSIILTVFTCKIYFCRFYFDCTSLDLKYTTLIKSKNNNPKISSLCLRLLMQFIFRNFVIFLFENKINNDDEDNNIVIIINQRLEIFSSSKRRWWIAYFVCRWVERSGEDWWTRTENNHFKRFSE